MTMCIKHNKQALSHLLEIEECNGWCNSADPCKEIINAVKNCKECSRDANPEETYPYWYDGGIWLNENDEEISYQVVLNYIKMK